VAYVIPSNDDAIRAIKLLVSKMADAVIEGKSMRKDEEEAEEQIEAASSDSVRRPIRSVDMDEDETDEALLGKATLAKLAKAAEADDTTAEEETSEAEAVEAKEVVADEADTTVEAETIAEAETPEDDNESAKPAEE